MSLFLVRRDLKKVVQQVIVKADEEIFFVLEEGFIGVDLFLSGGEVSLKAKALMFVGGGCKIDCKWG